MDLAKRTVLVIDDDLGLQAIYMLTLERAGYNVVVRGDATSGLRWLEQILPDLIILDMMLPGISGMEMLKLVRSTENGRLVPIIVATAHSELQEEDFAAHNITRLLHKPIMPSDIVAAVNQCFN